MDSSHGGKIGSAGEVHLDYETGRIEWLSVRTGWFGTRESCVPLNQATVSHGRIEVPFTGDQVTTAPPIDVDGDLGQAQMEQLDAHYGPRQGERPCGAMTTMVPAAGAEFAPASGAVAPATWTWPGSMGARRLAARSCSSPPPGDTCSAGT